MKKKLIRKVREEGYSIENNGTHKQIQKVLNACYPEDEELPSMMYVFFYTSDTSSTLWDCRRVTDKPKDPSKVIKCTDFFKKKKSNKKLKKRVQRLEAKYLQLKNIMLSKQDSSKTEHTDHLSEEQTEAGGKTFGTEPTVLVEGEVYRDVYKTGRIVKDNGYEVYSLCDVLTIDGKIFNQDTTGNTWTDGVTKLTPEEEEAYLIEVAGHRGLKVGERFVSVTGKLYSEIEAFESHNGCLYRTNGGGCLYFKPDKKWATPEPVQENKVKWTTYLDSKGYTIYSSNGKIDESVCDYKITKYANEETPIIDKL